MHLKTIPEDFIVDEMNTLKFDEHGRYSYYKLTKRNTEMQTALQQIGDIFRINRKYINFAGLKDKVGITTQYISISQGPEKNIKRENLELIFLGKGKERLNLGMLDGNRFTITAREIDEKEKEHFLKNIMLLQRGKFFFVNYYDDQRFGIHADNHLIGKMLVKKQFREVVSVLEKREEYAIMLLKEFKERNPTDPVGALRRLPKKLLLLFVHAYQSYLWNETVKEYMRENPLKNNGDNIVVPIIGFSLETEEIEIGKIKEIIQKIMTQENITPRDFLVRQIPELTSAGGSRNLLMECKEFSFEEQDEKTIKLSFSLGKGSYATMVVKELFSSLD